MLPELIVLPVCVDALGTDNVVAGVVEVVLVDGVGVAVVVVVGVGVGTGVGFGFLAYRLAFFGADVGFVVVVGVVVVVVVVAEDDVVPSCGVVEFVVLLLVLVPFDRLAAALGSESSDLILLLLVDIDLLLLPFLPLSLVLLLLLLLFESFVGVDAIGDIVGDGEKLLWLWKITVKNCVKLIGINCSYLHNINGCISNLYCLVNSITKLLLSAMRFK